MNQFSTTVNLRQPDTLPRNTIQNPKKDGHCMAITTRGGKQTIDSPMSSEVEIEVGKDDDEIERNFITMLKQLSINILLIEALEQMPEYVKFMKDLVTKKRSVSFEDDDRLQHCSVISTRSLVQKKEDPGAFTIPCTIRLLHFPKALCDLSANINLMPLSIYKKLGLGAPKPTAMRLLMVDRTVKRPISVLQDVLAKVESFIFPADFVILDCEVILRFPLSLGDHSLPLGVL
ncbi:hypothetical protein R3W88_001243 [Solanum pinnatisectum]|uniref:Uncharacterized protein n=1 Tax=Solanum pinnatisectum TaxID=50273 RepID=A0AAV9MHK5_9SOLN|nr:hypothetical protein R3W88_001243 [Solanum pinnatisectum]